MSKKQPLLMVVLSVLFWLSAAVHAQEEGEGNPKYSYFSLEPEITTNYVTEGRRLGFIKVKVELMVDNPKLVSELEYHSPLIRDVIIETLNQQTATQIKSLSGRETIRKTCLEKVNEHLLAETNRRMLTDLLFTKYLYQ
ncbi:MULTISPECIES: flagellar basal body-associated protein FliL [Salinivibrio]|uniref:Flagellar protein FliL n=1 Tax=Salinivibrio siamensis TaxID=414286 RepID=A0ABX3KEA5_9GAMM|nr:MULTISPECIES: flagellar basal body-associated protein FliL [Salinivibrio]KKA44623.1 flagellar basal body-associated protein FliL-like protein [Salinivibrio sp. KP-1]OOE68075.1 flagellar basal body-associated protein FliL [Salinivibrio sp. IB868]OOE74324.1 flagellar basal body-associated protein FliL [Salinivibrio sp. ML290]OOE74822.1 flagellar basal body-associated protein FliL [Salinivibrio sp. IB870]OOE80505.1 flagellar basal body-associated protein FliL [Salinivibrio sp. ML198]